MIPSWFCDVAEPDWLSACGYLLSRDGAWDQYDWRGKHVSRNIQGDVVGFNGMGYLLMNRDKEGMGLCIDVHPFGVYVTLVGATVVVIGDSVWLVGDSGNALAVGTACIR